MSFTIVTVITAYTKRRFFKMYLFDESALLFLCRSSITRKPSRTRSRRALLMVLSDIFNSRAMVGIAGQQKPSLFALPRRYRYTAMARLGSSLWYSFLRSVIFLFLSWDYFPSGGRICVDFCARLSKGGRPGWKSCLFRMFWLRLPYFHRNFIHRRLFLL